MAGPSRRQAILEAAARVVEDVGAAHLTIDAVASAAAVSKGGVLYHFPSKQALLEGMLQRLLVQMAERTAACRDEHDGGNAELIARIVAEHEQQPAERAMARAILAAAAEDPGLLTPARQEVQAAFDQAAAGSAPAAMGWVLLLAVEGLRFLEMLDLLPLSAAERRRLHAHLLQLARTHAA
ncbi:MAG: TetR family transcriptional regulator [Pseudomonadales bacterium]